MFEQIVNLALPLYIEGLNISLASTTMLAIAPGQARDSTDELDMPVGYPNLSGGVFPARTSLCPEPLLINSAVVGANGLDAGALGASLNYIIYLIGDKRNYKPVAGLVSLASNAYPLLPDGYDSWRMLGFVSTTAGSVFDGATILNTSSSKSYFLQPPVSVLAAGNAIAFAVVDLSPGITTTTNPFVIAYLDYTFIPAAAGDTAQIRPAGSLATSGLVTISGVSAGVAQSGCIAVMTAVSGGQPKIEYKVSVAGDSLTLLVKGWSVSLA